MNLCPRCGRDLDEIPEMYRPFVHLGLGGVWCLDYAPELQECVDELSDMLLRDLKETLDKMIVEPLESQLTAGATA